jgi:hypothetical protein
MRRKRSNILSTTQGDQNRITPIFLSDFSSGSAACAFAGADSSAIGARRNLARCRGIADESAPTTSGWQQQRCDDAARAERGYQTL